MAPVGVIHKPKIDSIVNDNVYTSKFNYSGTPTDALAWDLESVNSMQGNQCENKDGVAIRFSESSHMITA